MPCGGRDSRALLIECAGGDVKRQTAIMAAWAVAWAGSKPIASLTDGGLAGIIGVRATGILLAAPALLPALILILLATDRQSGLRGPLVRVARWSERNRYSATRNRSGGGSADGPWKPVYLPPRQGFLTPGA